MPSRPKKTHSACGACPVNCRISNPFFVEHRHRVSEKHPYCAHFRCSEGYRLTNARILERLDYSTAEDVKIATPLMKTAEGRARLIDVTSDHKKGYVDLHGNFYTLINDTPTKTGQKLTSSLMLSKLSALRKKIWQGKKG